MKKVRGVQRVDSEYFRKEFVQREDRVRESGRGKSLRDLNAFVRRGAQPRYADEGLPVINSKHVRGMFVTLGAENRLAEIVAGQPQIQDTDVLINGTGIGTVGRVSMYAEQDPAIPDNHVTIVRSPDVGSDYLSAFLNSNYGQAQLHRRIRGSSGQVELYPADILDVQIWLASEPVQAKIIETYGKAFRRRKDSERELLEAQRLLLKALGLSNWTPLEPLAYSATANEVVVARRLDPRYFAPRIQALLDILSVSGRKISDVAGPRREKFRPDHHEEFEYIEIGDVDAFGSVDSTRLLSADAPSRATWYVRPGDVISSTVRPIRRLSAQIMPSQDGFVCSSGFVVIEPYDITPEVILTFLRLPPICELLDLFASASMYPAITDADIFNLPFPMLGDAAARDVMDHVRRARTAKRSAERLLSAAKRAVEIAIDDNETAALSWLVAAEEVN